MGVQVIQDHTNHLRLGEMVIDQITHAGGKVLGRAAGRHLDVPPALQGVQEHNEVAGPFPTVLVVVPHWPAWSQR